MTQRPVAEADAAEVQEVVVTGRAGSLERTKLETSYALTVRTEEELRQQAPLSVAEVFKAVPGFWVESSGGEASNNVRARGIPREGYSSIGLHEDGAPVQHDPGLGFLNADQSFRLDETYERIEVVRGGPASIFASNAPGGIVNFITRKGGETFEGLARGTVGDYGLYRGDFWFGGPVGGGWSGAVGGFYRQDDGIRETGFTANEGGQIRASLGRDLPGGRVDLDLKRLDDTVVFFLGVPLTFDGDGDPAGVPGFDPLTGTLAGPDTERVLFRNTQGRTFDFDLSEGTSTELTQFTARLDHEGPFGFEIQNNFRVRTSETTRNGLFPGSPVAGQARLDQQRTAVLAAFPGATQVQLRYAGTGEAFDPAGANGNGLVIDGTLSSVQVPLDEVINDLRFVRAFDLGGQLHDVALGVYYAGFELDFDRYSSTALLDVRNNARRLDLVALNAAGQVVGRATENGLSRYGSQFNNASAESDTFAVYASDEWSINDRLRIDLGVRYERVEFEGVVERQAAVNLGVAGTLADDQVLAGTGVFDPFAFKFDDWGWTAGVNYQFTPDQGVFARYTETFRLPNATDYTGNATRTDVIIEPITLGEVGYKLSTPQLDVFLTGFYTAFEGFRFSETLFNPATGVFTQRTEFADTETLGVELEGTWRPVEWFDLNLAATYQDAQFENFVFNENVGGTLVPRDFSGNRLLRVPELSARIVPGVNIGRRGRLEAAVEYYDDRFADAANSVTLPAYYQLNLSARYDLTEGVSVYAFADNVTDEIGLTEGNPRAGQFVSGDAGARFYSGRPILGRSFRAAVLYRF